MFSAPLSSRQWTGSYLLAMLAGLCVILWSAASLLADNTFGSCTLDGFDKTGFECTDTSCLASNCAVAARSCTIGPFGSITIPTLSFASTGLGYDGCAEVDDEWSVCHDADPGNLILCSRHWQYYDFLCIIPVCYSPGGATRECDSTLHCDPGE